MRKSSLFLSIVWIIVALVLTAFLYSGIKNINNFFNKLMRNEPIRTVVLDNGEVSFKKQKLNHISISVTSSSVEITGTNDDKISVDFFGDWKKDELPEVICENNILSIKTPRNSHMISFGKSKKIQISIPEECLSTDTKIRMAYASGSMKLNKLTAEKINIDGASGSVSISDIRAEDLSIEVASGSIKIENTTASDVIINSASGSIKAIGSFDGINIHSASGSISIDNAKELTKDSSINSLSGSVKITIPENSNFVLKCRSTSGSIQNGITGNSFKKSASETVGSGKVQLAIETTSGSIKIN